MRHTKCVEWHSRAFTVDRGVMSEAVAGATPRRATFRDVLAVREYRALYISQTLSIAGDQLARIAVAVIVYTRTGSTFLTGLSYAVSYLPWLIGGPLLSGYADRKPRRHVMITSDLARAAVLFGHGGTWHTHRCPDRPCRTGRARASLRLTLPDRRYS